MMEAGGERAEPIWLSPSSAPRACAPGRALILLLAAAPNVLKRLLQLVIGVFRVVDIGALALDLGFPQAVGTLAFDLGVRQPVGTLALDLGIRQPIGTLAFDLGFAQAIGTLTLDLGVAQ